MGPSLLPACRDLVLIGGGHTHALVLRRWAMAPLAGVRLTLIDPSPAAAYSGMLPGFVAGHYTRDELNIDLVRLARCAGARLIMGAVELIDPVAQRVQVAGRPPIAYDVASIDIGITTAMPDIPGFADHAIAAKPLARFADAWSGFVAQDGPARVAVIGAGVAGVELALAMAHALRNRPTTLTLIDRGTALSHLPAASARHLRRALQAAHITLREGVAPEKITAEGVTLTDGTQIPADFVTGAAGAHPHPWLGRCGLALEAGFVTVSPTLQSSDPRIFATGDCAHMQATPRPKAGVFAVRQAPVLYDNLRVALSGKGRMRPYRPQRDYLKLVSLGGQRAFGDKAGLRVSGGWVWRWKDRIDRRFMEKFHDLPVMAPPPLPRHHAEGLAEALGPKPLCGGCGAKVGPAALRRALDPAGQQLPGDDAAILQTGGVRQVISTDHLRAMVEDPVVMTRIAAVHALGDVWAMGARPQAATASLILPRLSPTLAERTLTEMLEAARGVLDQAGARLAGGHSTQGAEMTIGFTVTGLCDADPITLAGARPGDALILTKPIGTGVIMAAEMALGARGDWVAAALDHMQRPQHDAAAALRAAHAMTDVTGFGLAGHLANICEASATGAQLWLNAVPLLPGALALAQRGTRSSLFAENRQALPALAAGQKDARVDLLFDPQTSGGLLAAVAPDQVEAILRALPEAVQIGVITDQPGQIAIA